MLMKDYISTYSLCQLENMGCFNYIKNISNSSSKNLLIIKSVFKKSIINSISKGHVKFSCIYDFIPKLNIYLLNNKKSKIGLFIIEMNPNSTNEFMMQSRSIFTNKSNLTNNDIKTIILYKNNLMINEFNYLYIATSNIY